MRLHRLEILAFGPFAQPTVIDFDVLGADGLFLLHGRTGAGKTTVLDAIAFALYGKVPGARSEGKRLHSDHAPEDVAPKVVLEATLGGQRLRITRSPEFHRPGRKTAVAAKATLTWLDGERQNLSRIQEIGDEVIRLLGMSADQFFQVVLLPQGDFARFLRADNEEREKLLEKLFDTERFGVVEQWLAERRREAGEALAAQRQQVIGLMDQIAGVTGQPRDEAPLSEAEVWAQDLLAATRAEVGSTGDRATARRAAYETARRALDREQRARTLRERAAVAHTQLDDHAAEAAHRAALRAELEAAHRADPVVAAVHEARDALETAGTRVADRDVIAARLGAAVGDPGAADIDGIELVPVDAGAVPEAADLEPALHAWLGGLGRLDERAADADAVTGLTGRLEKLASAERALHRERDELAGLRESLPGRLAAAEARLREADGAAVALPGLTDAAERCDTAVAAAIRLVECRGELVAAQTASVQAKAAHNDARAAVLHLRERRLAGMAAELATGLRAGEPCQVCGSAEHPRPAVAGAEQVSKAAEAAAAERERAAERVSDSAHALVNELERTVSTLAAHGGDADRAELEARRRAAALELADARELANGREQAAGELARLRTESERLQDRLRRCETELGATVAEQDAAGSQLEQVTARVRAAAGADGSLARRRTRLRALVQHTEELRSARAQVAAAVQLADSALARAERLANDAGFVSNGPVAEPDSGSIADRLLAAERRRAAITAQVGPAARPARWQRETATALEEAELARDRAQTVLDEPEVGAALAAEPAELTELESGLVEAQELRDQAVADHSDAQRRVAKLEQLSGQLWSELERFAPQQARFEELEGLAKLVSGRGQNNRQMSLRSYVLAARLEEVAAAASARLRRMSGGRYELVHSDRANARNRLSGLGLDIRDDYTGRVRPAKTLSGGETFMASLSLALGLADTVAAESGGIVLDTLFIDEGFGGLDADTLDAVMGVLDELRAGGRVVGIVSHVDEMRQRIPSRLHVVRGREGSSLRATVA
ncbi:AAA family ATPase [Nocardia asteroides]|uniref:AAA family ATPase n=1 Tax=Nocardia asteroides TaxID=1824 RepID=UPI001E4A41A9|nr:SMC family ATPase [Nocardia asteroides]UGT64286.1 SMC family ATPase [Nocardia asteroides]